MSVFLIKNQLDALISLIYIWFKILHLGNAVAQWLKCRGTNREVVGSIPDDDIGIFH